MKDIDRKNSTHWAIASVGGGGLVVGVNFFDLVNLHTGRGHGLILVTGGFSAGLKTKNIKLEGTATGSPASYTKFQTRRPVNFNDFDFAGASFNSGSYSSLYGFSLALLTIMDIDAGIFGVTGGGTLANIPILDTGWGIALSVNVLAHGVMKVTYGSGRPMGLVGRCLHIEDVMEPDKREVRVQIKAKEDPLVK